MKRIFKNGNYITIDLENNNIKLFNSGMTTLSIFSDHMLIESSKKGRKDFIISNAKVGNFYDEEGVTAFTKESLIEFFENHTGGNTSQEPLEQVASDLEAYMSYNASTGKIESSKPITTTLNSFYLGEQHKISSSGENIAFTNLTSDIDFSPVWSGIRNQSEIVNQGDFGIIKPAGRTYGNFIDANFYGDVGTTAIDYVSSIRNLAVNMSLYGIEFSPAETLSLGDFLFYSIFRYDELEGETVKIYTQKIKVTQDVLTEISNTGNLTFWFDHPTEIHSGANANVYMRKGNSSTYSGSYPLLKVNNTSALGFEVNPYIKAKYRIFEDKNVLLDGDLDSQQVQENSDNIALLTGAIIIRGNWNPNDGIDPARNPVVTIIDGDAFIVSHDGTYGLGGISTWLANDIAVKTSDGWAKIDNSRVQEIIDNLSSNSSFSSLSANQGRILSEAIELNSNAISATPSIATPLHYQQEVLASNQTIVDPSIETAINFPTIQTDSAGLYEVSGKIQMNLVDDDNGSWADTLSLYVNNVQVGLTHRSYKKIENVSDNSYSLTFSFTEDMPANADIVIKFYSTAVSDYSLRIQGATTSHIYSYIDLKQLPTSTMVIANEVQPTYSVNTYYEELGGYVIDVNSTGTHGIVAAMQDQTTSNWHNAFDVISDPSEHDAAGAEFRDWRIPTKRECTLIYNSNNTGSLTGMVKSHYWSSISLNSHADYAYLLRINDGTFNTSQNKGANVSGIIVGTRAVRSF